MTDRCAFVCPKCKGELARAEGRLRCTRCPASYQLVAGDIPIFLDDAERPANVPDPGIPFTTAIELAEKLEATPGTFHDLVDAYYKFLLEFSNPELYDYYRNITRARRVGATSDELAFVEIGLNVAGAPLPQVRVGLEFGCGWGFSLAGLANSRTVTPAMRGARIVGFDLNPAILAVAKRLFKDLKLEDVHLAIADATRPLPFPDGSVDLIYSNGVVEHIPAQDALMQNLSRVLGPDSALHFLIPNRYMIHPEPHFGVRWVGFFPRRYQRQYVAYRLGLGGGDCVESILSYSPRDLATLMGRNFPRDLLVAVPCRPADDATLLRRALYRAVGGLAANRYHCVMRRYPGQTPSDHLRGQLQLTTILPKLPVRRATVYRGPRQAA